MVEESKSSGLLRYVDWYTLTDVSTDRSAVIFRVKQSSTVVYSEAYGRLSA